MNLMSAWFHNALASCDECVAADDADAPLEAHLEKKIRHLAILLLESFFLNKYSMSL